MSPDTTAALEAHLAEAQAAHGVYERTELGGVYDEAWPRWYAAYAIDHGIGPLLSRPVSVAELARFLETSWDDARDADPEPNASWSASTARRIAAEL
jgi:hypothetical protein